ncbi:MAG: hypothetical protein ACK521_12550 [bacterium]
MKKMLAKLMLEREVMPLSDSTSAPESLGSQPDDSCFGVTTERPLIADTSTYIM